MLIQHLIVMNKSTVVELDDKNYNTTLITHDIIRKISKHTKEYFDISKTISSLYFSDILRFKIISVEVDIPQLF